MYKLDVKETRQSPQRQVNREDWYADMLQGFRKTFSLSDTPEDTVTLAAHIIEHGTPALAKDILCRLRSDLLLSGAARDSSAGAQTYNRARETLACAELADDSRRLEERQASALSTLWNGSAEDDFSRRETRLLAANIHHVRGFEHQVAEDLIRSADLADALLADESAEEPLAWTACVLNAAQGLLELASDAKLNPSLGSGVERQQRARALLERGSEQAQRWLAACANELHAALSARLMAAGAPVAAWTGVAAEFTHFAKGVGRWLSGRPIKQREGDHPIDDESVAELIRYRDDVEAGTRKLGAEISRSLSFLAAAAYGQEKWSEADYWSQSLQEWPYSYRPSGTLGDTAIALLAFAQTQSKSPTRSSAESLTALSALVLASVREDEHENAVTRARAEMKESESLFETVARLRVAVPDDAGTELLADMLATPPHGRLGLALSGGGFRASLFHIGVVARLCDADLLRSVDCISGVSGGSIVAAGLYLKLKEVLERMHDVRVGRRELQSLVTDLVNATEHAASRNLRTRVVANPVANLALWLLPNYTRTARLATLLDESFIAPLLRSKDGYPDISHLDRVLSGPKLPASFDRSRSSRWPVWLLDLPIRPVGSDDQDRDHANRLRRTKVPDLILNATALNNAHAFRFSPTSVGNAPWPPEESALEAARVQPVDPTHVTYWESMGRLRLSFAIAASAAVPGLFPPMALRTGDRRFLLGLVDGGVFDNQGLDALAQTRCNVLLSSDASQQLELVDCPNGALSILARTNDVLMDRVRQLQFAAVKQRARSGNGPRATFVHLKQGLSQERALIGTDSAVITNATRKLMANRTSAMPSRNQIHPRYHAHLAAIRTDLDVFSEIEAHALMAAGYAFMGEQLADLPEWRLGKRKDERGSWPFLQILPELETYRAGSRIDVVLWASRKRTLRLAWMSLYWLRQRFRPFDELTPPAPSRPKSGPVATGRRAIPVVLAFASLGVAWAVVDLLLNQVELHVQSHWLILACFSGLVSLAVVVLPRQVSAYLRELLVGALLPLLMPLAWLQIYLVDPIYRALGRYRSLPRPTLVAHEFDVATEDPPIP